MKRIAILLVLLTFAVSFLSAGGGAEGVSGAEKVKSTVLRYAHVGVEGEDQTIWVADFAARVKEATSGRVEIQVYPNSQLGNLAEIIEGVRTGSIAMAHHTYSSLGNIVPAFSVFDGPYVYRDAAHALHASSPYTSPVVRELNEELVEKAGIRVIANFYRGARHLSATIPVYGPSDLQGKKIRGIPVKVWLSMLEGMGAIPTPVEFAELTTALMTGLVIGQENPLNTIYSAKLHEVQNYIMLTGHMQSVLVVFINDKVWKGISAEDRKTIEAVAEEMGEVSLQRSEASFTEVKGKLEAEGITFIDESAGLDNEAFRTRVLAKINQDFPDWIPYIEEIQKVK
jgi:tripartite ATP-independent transporter DctP family solute receptor